MPGYFSSLFDGGDQRSDASDQHLAASDAADFDQTVSLHQETGGPFEDQNGTTHDFSSSHDVSVTVSAHVLVATAVDTAESFDGSNA